MRTDSVKPQNKVGLPVGAPGIIFFSIIPPLRSGEGEIKITAKNKKKTPTSSDQKKKIILNVEGGGRRNECFSIPERLR